MYRLNYSDEMLKRLLPAIKNQALGAADRLGIQEDLFALAKAGACQISFSEIILIQTPSSFQSAGFRTSLIILIL